MFNTTGWSYQTSSGIGVTIGELAEVTIQHARLYVNSPNGDTRKIIAQGVGGGVGLSFLPASISGSTTDFVSAGSAIYTLFNETITLADLSDWLVIYSGNLTWLSGECSGSLAIFLRIPLWKVAAFAAAVSQNLGSSVISDTLTNCVKGFCFMAAAQLSTPNAGGDATGTIYSVLSADIVTPE